MLSKPRTRIIDFLLDMVLDDHIFWNLENPANSWISTRLSEILGYGSDTAFLAGNLWREIIYPDDLKIFNENISAYLKNSNHLLDEEVRFKDKNNQIIWIRLRGMAIHSQEGRLLGIFFVSMNNTKQKDIESDLKKAIFENQTSQFDLKNALEEKVEFQVLNEELRSIPKICK